MRSVSVLRNRNFLLFFGGQLVSRLGDAIYSLGLVWLMHVLTNSTLYMSFTLAAGIIPRIIFGPVAGVFVDRWPKRVTLIGTDVVRLFLVSGLAALTFTHHVSALLLIIFSFVLATMSTLFAPSYYVLQKHIVAEDNLTQAYSWQTVSTNIAQIGGPALAGLIIGSFGLGTGFAIDAATFLVSLTAFLLVRVNEPPIVRQKLSVEGVFADMGGGIAALKKVPAVRALTPFMLGYNFLLAALENLLLVQFLANVLHKGAFTIGIVMACAAVGELVSSTTLALLRTKWTSSRGLVLNMIISAVSLSSIGFMRVAWAVGLLMFIAGFCMSIVNISFFTGIQEAIPTDVLGRVWALLGALFDSSTPLAQVIFGSVAVIFPLGNIISTLGAVAALAGVGAFLHPAIRRLSVRAADEDGTTDSDANDNVSTGSVLQ